MHANAHRMRRRTQAAVVAAVLIAGCATPPPPAPIAFVTRDAQALEPRVVKAAVEGTWCFSENLITVTLRPPWKVRLADTGRAVTRALESVPGANVLTNVRVRTRIEQYLLFHRVCAVVVGDAGHVE